MRPNVSIAIAYAKEKIVQSWVRIITKNQTISGWKKQVPFIRTGGKRTLAAPWISRPEVSVFQTHISDTQKPFANVPRDAKWSIGDALSSFNNNILLLKKGP